MRLIDNCIELIDVISAEIGNAEKRADDVIHSETKIGSAGGKHLRRNVSHGLSMCVWRITDAENPSGAAITTEMFGSWYQWISSSTRALH